MTSWLPARMFLLIALAAQEGPSSGRLNGQVFDRHSPMASSLEVARRGLSPATYDRFERYLKASRRGVATQAIDLGEEKFDMAGCRSRNGCGIEQLPRADHRRHRG